MYGAHCLSILSGGASTHRAKASLPNDIPQVIVVQQSPLHGYALSATWKWREGDIFLSVLSFIHVHDQYT